MPLLRRQLLKATAALAVLAALPARLLAARPDAAFESENFEQSFQRLFGDGEVEMSDAVTLQVPEIAENGAVVPVGVKSDLPGIDTIAVFVRENPNPLTASFDLGPATIADISTRLKMGKTTDVLAVVRSQGKLYGAEKAVQVTIGGCGG